MNIQIRNGYEKPQPSFIPEIRIIIDVFRASTTSLAVLRQKPEKYLIANDLEIVKRFAGNSYRVISEVFDMGIDNSPTLVKEHVQMGEKIIHKTTNLTTAVEANYFEGLVVIGCFNNLGAVVQRINAEGFRNIEIIPAGHMGKQCIATEDSHCAELMKERLLTSKATSPDKDLLLGKKFEEKKRSGDWPRHLSQDYELAVQLDISSELPLVSFYEFGVFSVSSW